MTDRYAPIGWLTGVSHPRLALVSVVGAVLVLGGGAFFLLASPGGGDAGETGLRLAIAGAILFLFGSTGYIAFGLFETAER